MTQAQIAKAFNEWLRRYTEDQAGYEAEFNTVAKYRAAVADGKEPDYGDDCAAYLAHLCDEVAS